MKKLPSSSVRGFPLWLSLIALLAFSAPTAASARAEKSFVMVIANNRSLTPGVTPLHYADDDGARWYELLAPMAARISLFTVLDQESQRVYRKLVPLAESPTSKAVFARLAEYNVEMEQARAAGFDPILYFVVVGHGEITSDGEGYVSLLDAPLTRGQLFREVIAPSKASFNHILIDACNAWLLVSRRGNDHAPPAVNALQRYFADEDLERYPNTGVVLSTSRAQATHEWSVYGGGIFSHEVRSALAGGADSNGDGRIEYSEVSAFVAAANLKIDDPRAHLDVFVRPPRLDRNRALVDLSNGRFQHFLRLPSEITGHYSLEDDRGVRFADVNKAPERPMLLALVDAANYFLRSETTEASFALGAPGTIEVKPEQLGPRTLTGRGSVEQSFQRHLFEVAYGPAFYRGYVASTGDAPVIDPPPRQFNPPLVSMETDSASGSLGRAALERRSEAAHAQARTFGLRPGDDGFADTLSSWTTTCLHTGNLREADRAVLAYERRIAEVVVDRRFVSQKLERLRTRLGSAPASQREAVSKLLTAAAVALNHDDAAAANHLLCEAFDRLPAPTN